MTPAEEKHTINLNTADLKTLTRVSGIGPAMAERIIAARPFSSLDDLRRVSGIGPQLFEKIQPYLSIETEDEAPPASLPADSPQPEASPELEAAAELQEEPVESPFLETEDEPAIPISAAVTEIDAKAPALADIQTTLTPMEEPAVSKPAPAPPAADRRSPAAQFTRADVMRMIVTSSLVTIILTVFITLGILVNLNRGSLQFALPADISQLSRQADDLVLQVNALEYDQSALRTRLDSLDSMAGRLNTLEIASEETRNMVDSQTTQVQTLTTQADALTQQIDSVSGQVETLSAQVGSLQSSSDRFQKFLEDLAALLANLLPKDE